MLKKNFELGQLLMAGKSLKSIATLQADFLDMIVAAGGGDTKLGAQGETKTLTMISSKYWTKVQDMSQFE